MGTPINGEAVKPTWYDFRFRDKFLDIPADKFTQMVNDVWVLYWGVLKLWAMLPTEIKGEKRQIAMELLIAWYILHQYPEYGGDNVSAMGSMPIVSKRIHDTELKYKPIALQDGTIGAFSTNQFGILFQQVLETAPENYMLYR